MTWKKTVTLAKFFGARLKQARESLGITGVELARRAKMDRHMISKFENGVKLPSLHSFVKLIFVLRVPPEHFIFPPQNKHQYLYIGDYTEEEKATIYAYIKDLKKQRVEVVIYDK